MTDDELIGVLDRTTNALLDASRALWLAWIGSAQSRRLFEQAERRSRNCREGEHRRLAPEDLGGGDRCPRHDLDLSVDARLIRVDLQEHIADAQGHALRMRDIDFDLSQLADHHRRPPTAQENIEYPPAAGIAGTSEKVASQGRLCDALVEPAYRSALAYRERNGSTALGATRLWPACPRTRSHIGMGHDPEVPIRDAPERAPRSA